jgi:hypothetical protein
MPLLRVIGPTAPRPPASVAIRIEIPMNYRLTLGKCGAILCCHVWGALCPCVFASPHQPTDSRKPAKSNHSHTSRPISCKSNHSHIYAKCRGGGGTPRFSARTEYRSRTIQSFRPSLLLSANYTLCCRKQPGRGQITQQLGRLSQRNPVQGADPPTPYSHPANCSNLPRRPGRTQRSCRVRRTLQMQEAQVTMRDDAHISRG